MNKYKFVLFGFFIFSIFGVKAQTDVVLETNLIRYNKEENFVELSLTFSSMNDSSILLYKPTIEDICFGLVYVNFQSLRENSSKYSLFPCIYKADLNSITLVDSNSIFLDRNNKYTTVFKLDISNVPNRIKKRCFKILVSLNYSYGNFISDYQRIFRGIVFSKNYVIIESR